MLTSAQTFLLYVTTLKFAVLTWLFTLIIGFLVAYFLVFHVKNQLLAIGLFLICTIPFWTSNIIRMISWIPLLGKEGLVNSTLLGIGVIREPLEVLLYSGLAVVIAYVHQLTIFMVVPIFNSLARIDKRVVEAALDAGASRLDVMRYHHYSDVEKRHRARIDLRDLDRDGRLLRGQGDVRRRLRFGGQRVLRKCRRAAISDRCGERRAADPRSHCHDRPDPARRRYSPGDHAVTVALGETDMPMIRTRRISAVARADRRPWTFYALATVFILYVAALYGPMICIYILSFQDIRGGLVFPMKGRSLHWFIDLFTQVRTGDVRGSFDRSIKLAVLVTVVTLVVSLMAGLAFRRRFFGDTVVFYLMIGSLVAPGLVLGLGIGLLFQWVGISPSWYTSALGAQLSWTLPFGVLVMFAVMSRFNSVWEEAARDLGATRWQAIRLVVIPVLAPGLVAVALFGFTLSYDEFARTLQTAGSLNTLPLEIWSMTLNVTSPSLYALGTVTTIVSFIIIGACIGAIIAINKRRGVRATGH